MRSPSLFTLALATLLPLTSLPAVAQSRDINTVDLDPVVISGGLSPIDAAAYGRSYSVVTADEITKRGISSIQDALRALPGVSVSGTGNSATSVRIRGLEGNHTLVLINGVDAAGGGSEYLFSGLETADIERIEVLRGPQSAFYGARASGGVINIITKKAVGTGYGIKAETGNGHLLSAYAQVRGAKGGLRFSVSDNLDKQVDISGKNGERDAIDRQTLRLEGDWQATDALRFTLSAYSSREKYHYEDQETDPVSGRDVLVDTPDAFSWGKEVGYALGAQYDAAGGRIRQNLTFARTYDYTRWAETDRWTEQRTDALKYRAQIGLDGEIDTAKHLLNVLIERQEDRALSPAAGWWQPDDIRDERNTTSYALEYRGAANKLNYQFGLRYDDNTAFKDFVSWSAAASYQHSDQIRLHASAGRASVSPTFTELRAIYENWQGNPYLKPEESTGYDLGVEFSTADGRGVVDVTAFYQVIENLIQTGSKDGKQRPENVAGETTGKGVEVAARYALTDQLSLGANYTYLNSKLPDGSQASRRPQHELGLQANWLSKDGKLNLSGDLRHVAGSHDAWYMSWVRQPVSEMPSYTVINVSAQYQLTDEVALTGRVLNLFDTDYEESWSYKGQDRVIWVGVSSNF